MIKARINHQEIQKLIVDFRVIVYAERRNEINTRLQKQARFEERKKVQYTLLSFEPLQLSQLGSNSYFSPL